MKKTTLTCLALLSLLPTLAQAQEAPAPRRMPRTPVSREVLVEARDPMPASRQLQGPAAIIDGEKLRMGESDLRLFGIVPPQLAASFGPQARAALDNLANGQNITCQIRDRDRDGRLLATCHNAAGSDMALELLKRGLAVTARGSIAGSELSAPYLAAEQAAQNQKIGLWSMMAAPAPITPAATAVAVPAKVTEATTPAPAEKDDKQLSPRTDKAATVDAQNQAKIAADVLSQQSQLQTQARLDDAAWAADDTTGFFERYQILIAGFLMLTTALSIIGALWAQKHRDRRDETKAVAAALRGELMAARSVCIGRAKSITTDEQDDATVWPRIRSTLYQAYVGRLGLLGAELARQVSATYGQSSDYAALYTPNAASAPMSKKHALETLAKNIDEILPKLAEIEQTGCLPSARAPHLHTPPPTHAADMNVIMPAAAAVSPSTPTPAHMPLSHAPLALWEAVRDYIQTHRNAIAQEPAPAPSVEDPHVADYAAIIEADMARYPYGENIEALDISPKKKRG